MKPNDALGCAMTSTSEAAEIEISPERVARRPRFTGRKSKNNESELQMRMKRGERYAKMRGRDEPRVEEQEHELRKRCTRKSNENPRPSGAAMTWDSR